MAGILEFFYNAALDIDYVNNSLCKTENNQPELDLIINYKYCNKVSLVFNKGSFAIFMVLIVIFLHECETIQKIKEWIPQSAALLLLGMAIGFLWKLLPDNGHQGQPGSRKQSLLYLTVPWLKYGFLPPVILNAAYELYNIQFFSQFWSILFLSIFGTLCNIFGVATSFYLYNYELTANVTFPEWLKFSSAVAAVDPVSVLSVFSEVNCDSSIYYLLFGESTLNDGVTYGFFNGFERMKHSKLTQNEGYSTKTYIFLTLSFITGPILAILLAIILVIAASLITKASRKKSKAYAPYIVTGLVWSGFFIADKLGFSAIIFTITSAFGQMHYTFPNLSPANKNILRGMIKSIATVFEISIFGMLGTSIANVHITGYIFTLIVLPTILFWRFVVTMLTFSIVNYTRQKLHFKKVSFKWQLIIFVGGLRGALAYIMAKEAFMANEEYDTHVQLFASETDKLFYDTILMIVFLTVILDGIAIKPLIYYLQLNCDSVLPAEFQDMVIAMSLAASETSKHILGGSGSNRCGRFLEYADRNYLKKWLCKDCESIYEQEKEEHMYTLKSVPKELKKTLKDKLVTWFDVMKERLIK